MNTLFARLSIALLAIVAITGGALLYVMLASTSNYYEEITQRLNESIAMYVTGQTQLIEDGVVDRQALAELAERAMIINPTVEVYLLGPDGAILGHGTPAEEIRNRQVEMRPINRLLQGGARLPLRGTDPRSEKQKIFSAFPVNQDGNLQGYLYAVLGGQRYDQLASSIRSSYVQQISLGAGLAVLATTFLVGLLVFGLLTRRLTRLTRAVKNFADSGFDPRRVHELQSALGYNNPDKSFGQDPAAKPSQVSSEPHKSAPATVSRGDEITQLNAAFNHMSRQIARQFEELKETDRLRRELISNVSHDLRTPLSSMHGYVETLLIKNDELSADERRHYLEITRKHSLRLEKLITDLFELSKLEAAAIEPCLEYFSLAELLHDVTQEFALDAQAKKIDLLVEGGRKNTTVHADIGLVQRVLENLMRNAIRHTPQGGTVTIRLEPQPDSVKVSVTDTGCGIAEQDLDRVFDRFYRSEYDDRSADDSAGLGLAIVQKILDLHGSRISVSSQLNTGTVFVFDLPSPQAA